MDSPVIADRIFGRSRKSRRGICHGAQAARILDALSKAHGHVITDLMGFPAGRLNPCGFCRRIHSSLRHVAGSIFGCIGVFFHTIGHSLCKICANILAGAVHFGDPVFSNAVQICPERCKERLSQAIV